MKNIIKRKIELKINIFFLKIQDESFKHKKNKKHYSIIIVSKDFKNKIMLERHRIIQKILSTEIKNTIWGINLYTYNINEWTEKKNFTIKTICFKKKNISHK